MGTTQEIATVMVTDFHDGYYGPYASEIWVTDTPYDPLNASHNKVAVWTDVTKRCAISPSHYSGVFPCQGTGRYLVLRP